MIAPEAHWQNARVERHGGILQAILDKMDKEKAISATEEFETALSFATQIKNKRSRHKGYPPEMLVFGKMSKTPGSVTSDMSNASRDLALQNTSDGFKFRAKLAILKVLGRHSAKWIIHSHFGEQNTSGLAQCGRYTTQVIGSWCGGKTTIGLDR